MDHYPRIAALPDGRLLITGDGSGGGNVNSTHTYLMSIGAGAAKEAAPSISFVLGPERSGLRKTFGTMFMDPNAPLGSYLLVGGLAGSGDINIGPALPSPDARIRVVGLAERYSPPSASDPLGSWSTYPHFLGEPAWMALLGKSRCRRASANGKRTSRAPSNGPMRGVIPPRERPLMDSGVGCHCRAELTFLPLASAF